MRSSSAREATWARFVAIEMNLFAVSTSPCSAAVAPRDWRDLMRSVSPIAAFWAMEPISRLESLAFARRRAASSSRIRWRKRYQHDGPGRSIPRSFFAQAFAIWYDMAEPST